MSIYFPKGGGGCPSLSGLDTNIKIVHKFSDIPLNLIKLQVNHLDTTTVWSTENVKLLHIVSIEIDIFH